MPQIRFEPHSRVKPESAWLNKFARKSTSQMGQDGILDKIYEVMGHANKFCVEFGAWDGVRYSNTWELFAQKGWSGVLIEGNGERCQDIIRNHKNNPKLQVVNTFVGWDGPNTLDAILARSSSPLDLDFASIDIDGNDWYVWEAMVKYRPRLVLIEFNPSIPNDVFFVQDRDAKVSQGASLRAMIELGKTKGYSLICAHAFDGFFVPDELFGMFNIADNSIDAMYDQSPYETKLFHGYDGTLFTAGKEHLLWNRRVRFDHDRLQLLPPEGRVFNG